MKLSAQMISGVLCSLLPLPSAVPQDRSTSRPAVAVEPVAAVLSAFETHTVVALSEGEHGNEQGYAFRLSLIRDPRFAATVNDIVVECGSSRYQSLMDRFVGGGDVPDDELRQIWRQGIEPGPPCDRPIYEEFGSGHFQRRNIGRNYDPENTIVSLLEGSPSATKVFSIWATALPVDVRTLQADTGSWPVPSLAMLRGTVLGAADFTFYYPYGGNRVSVRNGTRIPVPRDQWRSLRMEDQFDAMLYLGPPSALTISRLPRSLCTDTGYMEMRLGRLALFGMQDRIDGLKRYCAGQ